MKKRAAAPRGAQKPFLLYLGYKAVHYPFTPAPRHARRYEGKKIPYLTLARIVYQHQIWLGIPITQPEAYKEQGLTSLAVFAEPDKKFAAYAKTKKLNMLYALDPKKESWKVFGTKTMPSNFLIDKGGKVVAISKGCNPDGLKAMSLSGETAKLVNAEEVDVTLGIEPGSERKERRQRDNEK